MKKVTIYTDGACSGNPGVGGWAAILIFNGVEKEISGYDKQTTNNRMDNLLGEKQLENVRQKRRQKCRFVERFEI